MNVFADALADIHADPDVSVACNWAPGWARAWPRGLAIDLQLETVTLTTAATDLRCIDARPAEPAFAGAGQPAIVEPRRVEIVISALPAPAERGDLMTLNDEALRIEMVERDVEGLAVFVTLAEDI